MQKAGASPRFLVTVFLTPRTLTSAKHLLAEADEPRVCCMETMQAWTRNNRPN